MVILTLVGKWLAICFVNTDTTVPMVSKVRKDYHSSRTVDGIEKKLPVDCKQYRMKVKQRQNVLAEVFGKSFWLTF